MMNRYLKYLIIIFLANCLRGNPIKEIFIDGGTRALSMGRAYTSVSDGADAVFWNPANIHLDRKVELAGNYSLMYSVDGLFNYSSALAFNMGRIGNLAVGWNELLLSDIYNENLLMLGFRRKIYNNLYFGAVIKSLIISAPGYSKYNDAGFSEKKLFLTGDIGMTYNILSNLKVSTVFKNITSPYVSLISSTGEKDKMMRKFILGASVLIRKRLILSMDFDVSGEKYQKLNLNIGSEIRFFNALALRSGLNNGRLGLGMGLFAKRWAVDFGLLSNKILGNKYQFSIKLRY